jgi:glycosyltransferase involved in cell wall biosynthesis
MIVKNEEHNLPDCLGSAAGLFDEIVVVDTGSADRTKEIAAAFRARVYDFPWCDSFAAARRIDPRGQAAVEAEGDHLAEAIPVAGEQSVARGRIALRGPAEQVLGIRFGWCHARAL